MPVLPLPDPAIRPAEKRDLPAMLDLERRSMRAEVERLFPGRWEEHELQRTVESHLATARVAKRGAELLGLCYWEVDPDGDAWLLSVQVEESARRRGLGARLVDRFEAEARRTGGRRALLTAFRESPALGWYRRLGYQEIGEDGPVAVVLAKML